MDEMYRHHIWCNYFMRPREGCKMCDGPDGLFARYPYEGLTGHEMAAKYFPSAVALQPDDGVKLMPSEETK